MAVSCPGAFSASETALGSRAVANDLLNLLRFINPYCKNHTKPKGGQLIVYMAKGINATIPLFDLFLGLRA